MKYLFVRYFFIAVTKIPDISNLRKKRFVLLTDSSPWLFGLMYLVGSWQPECEEKKMFTSWGQEAESKTGGARSKTPPRAPEIYLQAFILLTDSSHLLKSPEPSRIAPPAMGHTPVRGISNRNSLLLVFHFHPVVFPSKVTFS
jgi:hypothetical protein